MVMTAKKVVTTKKVMTVMKLGTVEGDDREEGGNIEEGDDCKQRHHNLFLTLLNIHALAVSKTVSQRTPSLESFLSFYNY